MEVKMTRRRTLFIASVAGVVALGAAAPALATTPITPSDPIVSGLAGPLQLDVGSHGQIYTGQSFAGVLTKVRANGSTKDLLTEPGDIAGVASSGYTVTYTFTSFDENNPQALLKQRAPNGKVRTIADLGAFEAKYNPDAHNTYGFLNLSPSCAEQVPAEIGGEPYHGLVDSHPYALTNAPGGGWYVADAGGNDILKVSPKGWIKVVTVLKPQPLKVSAEMAQGVGLPDCTIGATYAFEPVPTDVELARQHYGRSARHGRCNPSLVVSLLPGGPEDESLGARGSVVMVTGRGHTWTMARGLAGGANVAVSPWGRVYVSELFGNQISVIRHGHAIPIADVPSPSGLEWANGKLYASVDVFGNGSIVTLAP
jgi:hypothetical protein